MARRRRGRAVPYRMTARRRAALKKAQAASARKRRRRNVGIGIGVLTAAGVGAAAYAGSKQPGGLSGVYKSGKASAGGLVNSVAAKAGFQPIAQEQGRIASAVSPASAPRVSAPKVKKPKATNGAASKPKTRTVVPTLDKQEQSALMKQATKPRGPSWLDESTFNEDGTVSRNAMAGISKELIAGKPITAQQAHKALGGRGLTNKQRSAIVNQMIAEGTVSRAIRGKKASGTRRGTAVKPQEWKPDEDYGFE